MPPRKKHFLPNGISMTLLIWCLTSVGFALTPMLFVYIGALLTGKHLEPGFNGFVQAVSSRGELLIVAVALLGEGVSDMLQKSSAKKLKISVGGFACLIPLIACCLLYAHIQTSSAALNQNLILLISSIAIIWAVCIGAACKFFARS
ncbi:hypothetical protein C7B65_01895 [Phormidesmis priestleyi ULC007]|uniref:Uncharacterized protein n=1 Tax=Phormidesmis priestleyi ULC007 TaxID=1920490 RepID=A0A2T1DP07_9CYAN|nr:hypothetical protein C7B65_01895 [Phormidesmis priestleyi ULC007]PZO52558.1 MAG: hypothetical protein DCF14_06300 [Phormidesmis priestleyi]